MKTMTLAIVFAFSAINLMQVNVRTVEIAQIQHNSTNVMVASR